MDYYSSQASHELLPRQDYGNSLFLGVFITIIPKVCGDTSLEKLSIWRIVRCYGKTVSVPSCCHG